MKKSICLISLLALCACTTGQKTSNGLTRLEAEPKNCEFLYNLDSSATTYKLSDAYDYVEKSILENKSLGDSYYVVNESILDNVGAVFGPEHTYKFRIKVYNCNK
jgi:hypothetical protein